MSSKIELNELNVSQYGDELLTLYVNGEYEAVIDMWKAAEKNENIQTVIALHQYENERIADKTVPAVVVDCVHTLEAQGHPKF